MTGATGATGHGPSFAAGMDAARRIMHAAPLHRDGGPAFPMIAHAHMPGMSLRDYFAAAALHLCGDWKPEEVAEWCYRYADAMLAERAK